MLPSISTLTPSQPPQVRFAVAAGVSTSDVSVTVTPASVLITANITVPSTTTGDAISSALTASLGTAALASSVLGITVEDAPLITVSSSVTSPSAASGGSLIGIIIGGAVGGCILLSLMILLQRKRSKVAPRDHNMGQIPARVEAAQSTRMDGELDISEGEHPPQLECPGETKAARCLAALLATFRCKRGRMASQSYNIDQQLAAIATARGASRAPPLAPEERSMSSESARLKQLRSAPTIVDLEELKEAIDSATAAGVAWSEVRAATVHLQRVQSLRATAHAQLNSALSQDDAAINLVQLQQAIVAAAAKGVATSVTEAAKATHDRVQQTRSEAEAALQSARAPTMDLIDVGVLHEAIEIAKVAGAEASKVLPAVADLQRVQRTRSEALTRVQSAAAGGARVVDLQALQRAIVAAQTVGVDGSEVVEAATKLQCIQQAREMALEAVQTALQGEEASISLAAVHCEVEAALEVGVPERHILPAKVKVLQAALARSRAAIAADAAEANALQEAIKTVEASRSTHHRSMASSAKTWLAEARAVECQLLAVIDQMSLNATVPTLIKAGFTSCAALLDLEAELLMKLIKLDIRQANELRKALKDQSRPQFGTGAYEEIEMVGRGLCDVIRARHRSTGKEVAIKQIVAPDAESATRGLQEAMRMQELHHELLVEIRTVFIQALTLGRQQVNIVMEYCAGGDLANYASSHAPLGEPRVLQLLTPVLSALAFVHSRGIAHCDIKPQNSETAQSN